jgi:processing peptidase subunit beta
MSSAIKRAASKVPLVLPQRPSLVRPLSHSAGRLASAAVKPAFSASNQSLLHAWPTTQVTTLDNGLRVATEPGHGETATVGVWIDTGSRYETEKNNGVAHFLEHMSFKGTFRRTRQALEQEVENLGGHLNAYTSRESTVFYAKVFKNDVPQAMDILSDILTNSKIEAEDIERERDTILREMKEVDGQLEEVIFDRLHQTAYRGTALSRTILGTQNHIETITRQDIKDYVATHYTAPRMVIAGAGAVQHGQLVDLAKNLFGKIPSTPSNNIQPVLEPARFTGSDILIRYDDMPQAYIAYGFPTAGWKDPDNFSLMLIQTMLGSWEKSVHGGVHSSSPLVASVAQYELASSISAFNTQYSDTGLFGIFAVADATTLNNLLFTMTRCMSNLSYDVDANALSEAKNQLKMNLLAHLDGSTVIAEDIGRQLLTYGRRMHPVEMMARIDAVDAAQIKSTARRYFQDRDHALAAIGPIWELPDYNWIRARSYQHLI